MSKAWRVRARALHQRWLKRRIPAAQQISLDHRRIFILPSRAGLGFLLLLAILLVGAINYQNSLVYGLTFLLLSLFWVVLHHSYRNLAGISLRATGGRPVFAGEQVPLGLLLQSPRRERQALKLSWPQVVPQQLDVPADGETAATLYYPTARRGWLQPERLRIETRFPLGCFVAWSLLDLNWRVLVYPRPIKAPLPVHRSGKGQDEAQQAPLAEGVDDFQGLRAYRPGDSRRRLDWRAYSRGQGLHSKIFAEPQQQSQWLDLEQTAGSDLEQRLGMLTGWILTLEAAGRPYGLALPGLRLAPALGESHRDVCLRALALYGLEEDA
ncbi:MULTISPECIES: DUF58 domain-containing protein [Pseudomonas]|uniref:DUF58 domain-containing protein n=1 Tax=Pseudomonas TaxID=286 RepID=UPI001F459A1A|nr:MULTISPECIES: DUF58 domain-containing protein [Pseudomonas]